MRLARRAPRGRIRAQRLATALCPAPPPAVAPRTAAICEMVLRFRALPHSGAHFGGRHHANVT
ncbi:MAG: hypothetical protein QOG17_1079 [Gammaproteobacteria bacterium]|nr:hypothetical protein [Gammaproteobacteria bacterium]